MTASEEQAARLLLAEYVDKIGVAPILEALSDVCKARGGTAKGGDRMAWKQAAMLLRSVSTGTIIRQVS